MVWIIAATCIALPTRGPSISSDSHDEQRALQLISTGQWASFARSFGKRLTYKVFVQVYEAEDNFLKDDEAVSYRFAMKSVNLLQLTRSDRIRLSEFQKHVNFSIKMNWISHNMGATREIPDATTGMLGKIASNSCWKITLSKLKTGTSATLFVGYH